MHGRKCSKDHFSYGSRSSAVRFANQLLYWSGSFYWFGRTDSPLNSLELWTWPCSFSLKMCEVRVGTSKEIRWIYFATKTWRKRRREHFWAMIRTNWLITFRTGSFKWAVRANRFAEMILTFRRQVPLLESVSEMWLGGLVLCVGGEREKLVQSNLPTPVLKDSLSH